LPYDAEKLAGIERTRVEEFSKLTRLLQRGGVIEPNVIRTH